MNEPSMQPRVKSQPALREQLLSIGGPMVKEGLTETSSVATTVFFSGLCFK
jgi:hypothetical protein